MFVRLLYTAVKVSIIELLSVDLSGYCSRLLRATALLSQFSIFESISILVIICVYLRA